MMAHGMLIFRIKDQLLDTESRYIVDREDRVRGYQNGGYHGGGGEERAVDRGHNWIAHTFADSKEIFTFNLQLQVLL